VGAEADVDTPGRVILYTGESTFTTGEEGGKKSCCKCCNGFNRWCRHPPGWEVQAKGALGLYSHIAPLFSTQRSQIVTKINYFAGAKMCAATF